MKLDANRLFVAVAVSVALAWVVCVALVGMMPGGMMSMTGYMMHANMGSWSWSLNIGGVVAGMLAWSLSAGALAWLTATIYNALGTRGQSTDAG